MINSQGLRSRCGGNLTRIGIDNQGASAFIEQILTGVTPEQFELETGSPELTFADEAGEIKYRRGSCQQPQDNRPLRPADY